ncbi:SGNH/GDSL hydrolase family protein [Candidatus Roizmanbacteria bacterium]|nr:SGNH/GDSL hydrolase family protein [Candidatus Roizmanbacteria bacterium]
MSHAEYKSLATSLTRREFFMGFVRPERLKNAAEFIGTTSTFTSSAIAALIAYDLVRTTYELRFPPSVNLEPFSSRASRYTSEQLRSTRLITLGDSITSGFIDGEKANDPAVEYIAKTINKYGGDWGTILLAQGGATTFDTIKQIQSIRDRSTVEAKAFWDTSCPNRTIVLSVGGDDLMKYLSDHEDWIRKIANSKGIGSYLQIPRLAHAIKNEVRSCRDRIVRILMELTDLKHEAAKKGIYINELVYEGIPQINSNKLGEMDLIWITDEKEKQACKKFLSENPSSTQAAGRLSSMANNMIGDALRDYEFRMKGAGQDPLYITAMDLYHMLGSDQVGIIHPTRNGQKLIAEEYLLNRMKLRNNGQDMPVFIAA